MSNREGWIGVDLDNCLARAIPNWQDAVGPPYPSMVDYVRGLLKSGEDVRIFTARMDSAQSPADIVRQKKLIEDWCLLHFGVVLPITNEKTRYCKLILDDLARQVWKGRIAPDMVTMTDDYR